MSKPRPLDLAAPMRSLRDLLGLTQKEMAERRDMSQQAIHDAEKIGEAVSVAKLREAAEACDCTLEIRVMKNKS